MGSHRGATPEGQIEVRESLGITESSAGVPIMASIEVNIIGSLPDGIEVYLSCIVMAGDGTKGRAWNRQCIP